MKAARILRLGPYHHKRSVPQTRPGVKQILVRVSDALIREGKSAVASSSNSRLSRVTCSETLQKRL
jgi:hypothetical protein